MSALALARVRRPCDECPWRADARPGRFERARWDALRASAHDERAGSAPLGAPLFACHKTAEGGERACAGWLAVEGSGHVTVRLAVVTGALPADALAPGPDWPPLFDTLEQARAHDLGPDA